ncbi:hypothetical protein BL254_15535 [Protofrankia sp. BMG5.30]|nr:hypothetical protein BL254_15535 [Protofrankia sp. BMG5.30]
MAGGAAICYFSFSFGPAFFAADVAVYGLAVGLFIVAFGLLMLWYPGACAALGLLSVIGGLIAFPIAAGGLGAGSLLAIIGGSLAAAWTPPPDGAFLAVRAARVGVRAAAAAIDLALAGVIVVGLYATVLNGPVKERIAVWYALHLAAWLLVVGPGVAAALTPGRLLLGIRVFTAEGAVAAAAPGAGPATGSTVSGTAVSGTAVSGTAVSGTAVSGTAVSGTAAATGTAAVPAARAVLREALRTVEVVGTVELVLPLPRHVGLGPAALCAAVVTAGWLLLLWTGRAPHDLIPRTRTVSLRVVTAPTASSLAAPAPAAGSPPADTRPAAAVTSSSVSDAQPAAADSPPPDSAVPPSPLPAAGVLPRTAPDSAVLDSAAESGRRATGSAPDPDAR